MLPDIGESPPRIEPAPLATFQRPASANPPDKYATIRTGGKYDKGHKYAQQMEREEAAATLERRPPPKRTPTQSQANGGSILSQPLPEPPAPQPLSAAHFAQYRAPIPPTPCCPQQGPQHRSHSAQGRTGRTPEKFFSTSSQQARISGGTGAGNQRPAYSHTLDRRHAHSQQQSRGGTQTLDRRNRQAARNQQESQQQSHEGNKDMYAVTEL